MTHISRPFQIVLAVFAVFVAVWFMALRAHNSSTTGGAGSSASVSAPATSAKTPAKAATTTTVHKASTAGHTSVHETTHVVHGENTSATTIKRSVTTATGQTTTVHSSAVHKTSAGTTVVGATVVRRTAPAKPVPAKTTPASSTPKGQGEGEGELRAAKTVLILFWNPKGADDVAVHNEVPAVQRKLGGRIAVHYASASQVGAYGTVTHTIQVNQTPTLLIVNHKGQTTVLTGLTDAFAIEQAIREAA
jgi:hypothetical protein